MAGLVERLSTGGTIVIAEGYLWEIERRGYAAFGHYTPEVVLDKPSIVKQVSEEFEHAGSDVIEACTYYAYREKMKLVGRENSCEKLNRDALRMAKEVASASGKLMAGNLSNTPLYRAGDREASEKITQMFKEQVEWAVDEGADYIIGETFADFGEALLALEAIKQYGNGLPAVITITPYIPDHTADDVPIPEACRKLEEAGAAVVGLNCGRGPATILPLIKQVRKACKGPIACLPVMYRTHDACKTFQSLKDPITGAAAYPENLDCLRCTRKDVRSFAEEAKAAGIQYIGLCCGNSPHLTRELADIYGRKPTAMKYACDQSRSIYFGDVAVDYGISNLAKHMAGEN